MSGIFVYTRFADSVRPEPVHYQADFSKSLYRVRLNRTFDCASKSEFDLTTSLLFKFKDESVSRSDLIPSSERIEFELPKVEIGRNSVFVEAYLAEDLDRFSEPNFDAFDAKQHALQIELLRDGSVIAEKTFWVEPGLNSVSGTMYFEIRDEMESEATQ